jgi:photosystem II stability/assembly factor-like uncharacterized protein
MNPPRSAFGASPPGGRRQRPGGAGSAASAWARALDAARGALRGHLLLACFAVVPAVAAEVKVPGFVDPLDAPARLSPRAGVAPVNALARVDADRVVAVGARGHILLSSDRGRTWEQQRVPVSTDLLAAHFPTPAQGWAVGHDGVVLRSTDGGASWVRVLDGRTLGALMVAHYEKRAPAGATVAKALEEAKRFAADGPTRPFMGVYFRDEREGWVVGQFNLILYTTDGGASWVPWLERSDNDEGYSMHAIGAAGSDVVIVGELGLVLRLDAAQQRFRRIKTPYPGTWFGMAASNQALVATGLRGSAWRSNDAGASWKALASGAASAINGGHFLPDGRLVLVTQHGELLLSADGGESFSKLPPVHGLPSAHDALSMEPGWLIVGGPRGVQRVALPPAGDAR